MKKGHQHGEDKIDILSASDIKIMQEVNCPAGNHAYDDKWYYPQLPIKRYALNNGSNTGNTDYCQNYIMSPGGSV